MSSSYAIMASEYGLSGEVETTSSGQLKWLPATKWTTSKKTTSVASKRDINEVAKSSSERQLMLSAENAPIRIVYGRDRIGGQLANVVDSGNHLYIHIVWCEGEIQAIESVQFDDKEVLPSGFSITNYLGTQTQNPDPWLVSAFASKGIAYSDNLRGIAYSVIRAPGSLEQFPQIAAVIQGRKLYDPRTSTTAYSANPALALADFLTSSLYGAGGTVDWTSVGEVANYCDELVGTEARRVIGVTVTEVADTFKHVEVLRTYAGCWVIQGDLGFKLVPDKQTAVSRQINHADGAIQGISPIRKRPITDAPTVMIVRYTDPSSFPWKEKTVSVNSGGVVEGFTPRRESEISLPGIHRKSQATREAIERLNKLTLSDISFELNVFDEGLSIEVGDVVSVSHPVGLTDKQMRVVSVAGESGRYVLSLSEYDADAYSNVIVTEPSSDDTSLPDPSNPTAATALTLTEEVFQMQDGTFSSRIRVNWVAPSFPWVDHYRINIYASGALIHTGTAQSGATTWASPSIQEGMEYQVDVLTVARVGVISSPATAYATSLGKQLPPGDVPAITGFEVGGEVRLSWEPAFDIDIWRYEIRYGLSTDSWEYAKLIDRVDALRLVTKEIPVGTWDFMVKALDSVGNYSATEARHSITVTLDNNAFLVNSYEFDTPTTSGMYEYSLGRIDSKRRWVTEDGVSVASKFVSTLDSYTNVMASYNNVASSWTSEIEDFGLTLAGNWTSEVPRQDIVGTNTYYLDLSLNGTDWVSYPGVAKATGRFARTRVVSDSGEVICVEIPTAYVRLDAVPRQEDGEDISIVSGPKTITLDSEYAAVKSVVITPLGTSPYLATIDNIVIGSPTQFDVYLFNSATGAQVSSGFRWTFEGV